MQTLRLRPEVKYSWLAVSPKWGYQTAYPNWTVRQNFMLHSVCGLAVDKTNFDNNDAELNDCQANDFGGFMLPTLNSHAPETGAGTEGPVGSV